jgi:hypothetical protein
MDRGLFLGDCTTAPTAAPAGGAFAWITGGNVNLWGSANTFVNIFGATSSHLTLADTPDATARDYVDLAFGGNLFHIDVYDDTGPGVASAENCLVVQGDDGATLGYVGIGTPTPDTKLHVAGSVHIDTDLHLDGAFNHDGTTFGALGAAPAAQAAHVEDPSGGAVQDVEARAGIAALNALVETFGFRASA